MKLYAPCGERMPSYGKMRTHCKYCNTCQQQEKGGDRTNARLIAAAPELLAWVRNEMLTYRRDPNPNDEQVYCCCARKQDEGTHSTHCDEARALLARIDGSGEGGSDATA